MVDRRSASAIRACSPCTLLQLVTWLTDLGASDHETVDIVTDLIRSGRVRLIGNFRDHPLLESDRH